MHAVISNRFKAQDAMRTFPVFHFALLLFASLFAAFVHAAPALRVGDKVQVQWHGGWYAATVLEVGTGARRGTYKISYAGLGSSWDEYVPPSRIAADNLAADNRAAAPQTQASRPAAQSVIPSPEGRYVCQAFEAGQLHNQGEFVLNPGGSYRDLMYKSGGNWSLDKGSGEMIFRGGSLANRARARLVITGQGKTAVEFTWPGDAKRWCYKQKG